MVTSVCEHRVRHSRGTAGQRCESQGVGRNTRPEMVVRRLAHAMGYRYRLHRRDLPGCPDLVFPSRRKIILVHGCFWHRHRCRKGRSTPRTRKRFWREKFEANRKRDRRFRRQLRRRGWKVLVIWECQTRDADRLAPRMRAFLDP